MIQFANNIEPFRKPIAAKKNKYQKEFSPKSTTQILRGAEYFSHQTLREAQRYGTLCVNYKEVLNAVRNDKSIIISQDDRGIKALVRFSSHYYIAVLDNNMQMVKTLLPPDCCDLLHYVQLYIEKQKAA